MRRSFFAASGAITRRVSAAVSSSSSSTSSSFLTLASASLHASKRWQSSGEGHRGGNGADFLSAPTPHETSPYSRRPTRRQARHQDSNSATSSRADLAVDGPAKTSHRGNYFPLRSRNGSGGSSSGAAAGHHSGEARRGTMKDRFPPVPTDLVDPRRRLAVLVDGSNSNLIPDGCTSLEQIYHRSALFTTVLPAVLQVGVPVLLRVFAHQLPSAWEPLLAGSVSSADPTTQAEGREEGEGEGGVASRAPVVGQGPSLVPLPVPAASDTATLNDALRSRVQIEYFRVERFIPVAMQIEADARHLYELRSLNKVEGVCYVCHEVDRAMYTSLMQEQRAGSAALASLLYGQEAAGSQGSSGRRPHRGSSSSSEEAVPSAFFNQYVLDELGLADELLIDGRSKDGS